MKHDHLVCPYHECKKEFERPVVLTDFSSVPRETYYACPHCLSKVDVVAGDEELGSVSVESSGDGVGKAPEGCEHYFGYLRSLGKDIAIPDGCLTCSNLLQCFVKKENLEREVK